MEAAAKGIKKEGRSVDGSMSISLISAVAENGVIGDGAGRVWYLPGDLRRFKALTIGKPIIMGSVTWSIIGRPLPDRFNIVLSRDPAFRAPGAHVVGSLEDAYNLARTFLGKGVNQELMVVGGGEVYAETINDSDRIYLTRVKVSPHGDVRFPAINPIEWEEIDHPVAVPDPKDSHLYSFVTLRRRVRQI